ncbi:amino acid adenylation domain-containing protein [Actinomadura sp. DC4]|uniref:non-ribosomal peptide synthetase n=1 Tax=Actinomadura sp. DC4 TaxID=3055069 RepID=UPI0025AEDDC2|nr:amino acid adenylation domain-containing protein [Actinomadura sp. DC4]MDN3354203.1 amino acid adenylation domain-containing protein [Actinomadura sp. DC4]
MTAPVPMSPEQAGVWFTEELGQAGTAYHLPLTVGFDGALDTGALRTACATVVSRHPVLATAVHVADGVPYLVPVPAPELDLIDLSGLPEDGRADAAGRHVEEETVRPFVRDKGPLCRFTLVTLDAARHVLVVVAHHLVFDGGSKDVFVAELAEGYRAAIAGTARPPLPAPSPAARRRPPEEEAAAREFWARRWTPPAEVTLPGDTAGARPVVAEVGIDATLSRAVGVTAERLGVTRFELLLAALRALLMRYGNDPVTVAVDLGTRTEETRGRIGMYVNQLPVGGSPEPYADFSDFARATRGELRELYPIRRVPLSHVAAGVPAGLSLAPVSVSYRRRAEAPVWPEGLSARVGWNRFNHAARGALHLQIVDAPDGTAATLAGRSEAVTRIAGHLRTLLSDVTRDPDRPLDELALMTEEERRQVVEEWNDTARPFPDATTVDRMIAAQVRATPDATAVEAGGERLTYAELNAAANRLAHLLREEGVRPGGVVGVFARRSADLVVGLLAVLKAGAAYLPLDPDQPDDRLAFMLADAGAELTLTASLLAPRLPAGVRAVLLEQAAGEQPAEDPEPLAGPDDPAYLIYTSGSTGAPKGVLNSHRGLCNRLDWMQREFALGADDAVLQKTPIGFDVSVWEFFWPLMTGARLVMASPGGHRDPGYLRQVIVERAITTVHFVPSMLGVFLEEPDVSSCVSLRRTICSGEELTPALAAEFLRRMPGELHNLYGPTEAAIDVSSWHCEPGQVVGRTRLPIGRPIQNMRLYVVDRQGNPVPAGIPGELLIGGPGVALGYLGREELTAERFVPDRFVPGGRLYRTGDFARWRVDGDLDYLGRMDRQVKLRGNRIEPGEVEAAIRAHPGVAQTAVVVAGTGGDRRLVAYVVPAADPADAASLRAHLTTRLPDYMIPAAFVVLDDLPLTPNGKLDHAALAARPLPRVAASAVSAADAVTGDGRLLEDVRAIWSEVLGAERIGLDDDLFDLGGHSLTITQIAARMRRRLRLDLPLQVFYDTPTVRGVVAAAGQSDR